MAKQKQSKFSSFPVSCQAVRCTVCALAVCIKALDSRAEALVWAFGLEG